MKNHRSTAAVALLIALGTVAAAAPVSSAQPLSPPPSASSSATPATPSLSQVISALERGAHPLRTTSPAGSLDDLRPLGRMVRDARVVGLGEATHGSHEFFALKHRVFRYLVEEKGFRSFSLEASWGAGLRLNDYVLHGKGDLRSIMNEEFQGLYSWWNNPDYRELLRWMRAYNQQHPKDPVQFTGNDFGYSGPQLYDRVTSYVAAHHPSLLPRFTELYRGLRPTTPAAEHTGKYMEQPPSVRQSIAGRTASALALLKQQKPAEGAGEKAREAYDWAVQHATALDQTARGYSFDMDDPAQGPAAMRYRDQVMADNVAWWQRRTGDKVLLSAHNGHVGLYSHSPQMYPKIQGAFLRDRLGKDYLSIGTTFDRGSFRAADAEEKVRTFTLGSAKPGSNEHTLDKVRHRDYVVDLRDVPAPARSWLATPRTTRSVAAAFPGPGAEFPIALSRSHDIVVHLQKVSAAQLLTGRQAETDRSGTSGR
ncbi:erythromycin esterase family protein [Streptomyces sp. NPDC058657]|uniref:erythromycin esterase family protein n=1 Tax=unclassified Streptomyces TaxID=2593676 RepID=UPI003669F91C